MLALLDSLIGPCPPGMEFLRYLFAFILTLAGLLVIAYVAHLPLDFISKRRK